MVRLAIHGDSRFAVDDLEIRRGGASYSVDTVAELRRRHPRTRFYFIIGADSLRELHRWHEVGRLVRMCGFVVLRRPRYAMRHSLASVIGRDAAQRTDIRVVDGHVCDVSSRELRAKLARGESVRYLLPDSVMDYIQRHKLYS
jgi:nicotinate-nucleotide adenylyltransferase